MHGTILLIPKDVGRLKYLLIIVLTLLTFLNGCQSYTKVNTDQINQFEKNINSQYKQIKGLNVVFAPTEVQLRYSLKEKINETETADIFSKTKELVRSKRFQKEVIGESYFNKFPEERKYGPPNVSIGFSHNEDGAAFEFRSDYEKKEGYNTWFYYDNKNDPVKVSK